MESKLTEEQVLLVKDLYQVLLVNHIPLGEYLSSVHRIMDQYIKEYKLKPLADTVQDGPEVEDVTEEEGEI